MNTGSPSTRASRVPIITHDSFRHSIGAADFLSAKFFRLACGVRFPSGTARIVVGRIEKDISSGKNTTILFAHRKCKKIQEETDVRRALGSLKVIKIECKNSPKN